MGLAWEVPPTPLFLRKSIIPWQLFFPSCKSIILRELFPSARLGLFPSNLQILEEFRFFVALCLRLGNAGTCKSIIPRGLLEGSRKSIIIWYLAFGSFRWEI